MTPCAPVWRGTHFLTTSNNHPMWLAVTTLITMALKYVHCNAKAATRLLDVAKYDFQGWDVGDKNLPQVDLYVVLTNEEAAASCT